MWLKKKYIRYTHSTPFHCQVFFQVDLVYFHCLAYMVWLVYEDQLVTSFELPALESERKNCPSKRVDTNHLNIGLASHIFRHSSGCWWECWIGLCKWNVSQKVEVQMVTRNVRLSVSESKERVDDAHTGYLSLEWCRVTCAAWLGKGGYAFAI